MYLKIFHMNPSTVGYVSINTRKICGLNRICAAGYKKTTTIDDVVEEYTIRYLSGQGISRLCLSIAYSTLAWIEFSILRLRKGYSTLSSAMFIILRLKVDCSVLTPKRLTILWQFRKSLLLFEQTYNFLLLS